MSFNTRSQNIIVIESREMNKSKQPYINKNNLASLRPFIGHVRECNKRVYKKITKLYNNP